MKAYILSYFGQDTLGQKRRAIHRKQLAWLLQYECLSLVILAMDYAADDYFSHPRVEYIVNPYDHIPGVAEARNTVLKRFYSSGELWGLMLDNDSILYSHQDGLTIIPQVALWGDVEHIDVFVPVNSILVPYKKDLKSHATLYATDLAFTQNLAINGAFIFMKNVALKYGVEVLLDPTQLTFEDQELGLGLAYTGCGLYTCKNIILKEMASSYSTIEQRYGIARGEMSATSKRQLAERWKDRGVRITDRGTMCRREFVKAYFHHPRRCLVDKETQAVRAVRNFEDIDEQARLF